MADRWLIDVLRTPGLVGLDALVRDDVRFRSPYADYQGRHDVTHVLRLITRVLDDVQVTGEDEPVPDGPGSSAATARTARFTAAVGGAPVQGVLCEDLDASGRLAEAMLLLRPFGELRAAMRLMRELLDDAPLPSLGA
jgi:hypothetical protein